MDQNKLYDLMFAILKFLYFKVSVASFKFFLCFSITKGYVLHHYMQAYLRKNTLL